MTVPLLVALAAAALPATAGTPGEEVAFALTGHYQLRIDGELDPGARLYLSAGTPRLLVVTERLAGPVLVVSRERTVRALPAGAVECSDDGETCRARIGEGSGGGGAGSVSVLAGKLRFQAFGRLVVVEPHDPLLGLFSAEELLAAIPEYRRGAAAYTPRRGDLRLLATVEEPVDVEVFFGSWCPHCERYVPRLLSVARALEGEPIRFRFRGLPRDFAEDPLARQYGIEATPTAVVRRGTRELGRITGAMWEHPEAALSAVLFGGE
ncbi:MAG: thioredoxin [Acidobacteria bacterium]|nr:MAG: thioredoxin [Acidobacteriota bacterium]